MKILVITDLHFGARNSNPYIEKYQLEVIKEQILPAVKSVDKIFILGDVWDNRKSLNINTYNIFRREFFDKIKDKETYILIGNHDIYFKNRNDINSLSSLEEGYDNIYIIKEFEKLIFDGKTFGMMSWINNDNLERALEFIKSCKTDDIICGHFEAKGFETTKGVKSEHGLDHTIFSKADMVWSGHFHIPSKKGNFEYIGNPFELTWADYGVRKGFYIYDTKTNEFTHIKTNRTLHTIIKLNENDNFSDIDIIQYKDKFVRVYINLANLSDATLFNNLITSLTTTAISVEVIDTAIYASEQEEQLDVSRLTDTRKKIEEIINNMELKDLDVKIFSNMFLSLYDKVKS